MSKSNPVPIPLPILGLNTVNPHIDFESGYARELTNLSIFNGRLFTRPAVRQSVQHNSGLSSPVAWYDFSSGTQAILKDGTIRKLSDGTGATSIGGAVGFNAHRVKHVSLDLVIGCRAPRDVTSPFTAWTFTTLGITATNIQSACSHRGRLYVSASRTVEYSAVGAVTGTMAGTFDMGSFLSGGSIVAAEMISRMFSLTIDQTNTTDNVLIVFGDRGTVLIWEGTYPGSPTWNLKASYKMPPPVSSVGFVEKDGDIFVASEEYAYWARDLLSGGAQTAYANSPTKPIENLWARIGWSGNKSNPEVSHSFYEPYLDAIIVQCSEKNSGPNTLSSIAEYGNEGIFFVYFRKYRAWAVWFTVPFFHPVRSDESGDGSLYGVGYVPDLRKLTHGYITDRETDSSSVETLTEIETCWKTPYLKSDGIGIKANTARVFFENSSSGYLDAVGVIYDYSDFNSVLGWKTQSQVTDVPPGSYSESAIDALAQTYSQYSPLIGLGGIGGSLSFYTAQQRKADSAQQQTQSIYHAILYPERGNETF